MATLGTHALAPHLGALPYDPGHDFAPVSLVAAAPLVLACTPGLGLSSAAGLIELARERPRTLTYGTSAVAVLRIRQPVVAASADAGVTACGTTPEAFEAFMVREMTRWGPVVTRLHGVSRVAPE